jgi:ribokinase
MRLHVIGNVTEDLVFRLDRLPLPGETRIAADRIADIGGKGFNQALIAARAGVSVRLTAPIGTDDAGRRAATIAAEEGLMADFPTLASATDQSIIWVDGNGENVIVSSAVAAQSLTRQAAISALDSAEPVDWLLLQGNLTRDATEAALRAAREKGVATAVNAAPIQWSFAGLWPLVDLAIVNSEEARILGSNEDPRRAAEKLLDIGASTVLLTLGAEGAVHIGPGGACHAPAYQTEVVDTAGAGDTFTAVFLAAVSQGKSEEDALAAAARGSALTVSRPGTFSAFPTKSELASILGTKKS